MIFRRDAAAVVAHIDADGKALTRKRAHKDRRRVLSRLALFLSPRFRSIDPPPVRERGGNGNERFHVDLDIDLAIGFQHLVLDGVGIVLD